MTTTIWCRTRIPSSYPQRPYSLTFRRYTCIFVDPEVSGDDRLFKKKKTFRVRECRLRGWPPSVLTVIGQVTSAWCHHANRFLSTRYSTRYGRRRHRSGENRKFVPPKPREKRRRGYFGRRWHAIAPDRRYPNCRTRKVLKCIHIFILQCIKY